MQNDQINKHTAEEETQMVLWKGMGLLQAAAKRPPHLSYKTG
jgi:hypothetical protein